MSVIRNRTIFDERAYLAVGVFLLAVPSLLLITNFQIVERIFGARDVLTQSPIGEVIRLQKSVRKHGETESAFYAASAGDPVFVGDTILTGKSSGTRITLSGGEIIELGPESMIRIEPIRDFSASGGVKKKIKVTVEAGTVKAAATKPNSAPMILESSSGALIAEIAPPAPPAASTPAPTSTPAAIIPTTTTKEVVATKEVVVPMETVQALVPTPAPIPVFTPEPEPVFVEVKSVPEPIPTAPKTKPSILERIKSIAVSTPEPVVEVTSKPSPTTAPTTSPIAAPVAAPTVATTVSTKDPLPTSTPLAIKETTPAPTLNQSRPLSPAEIIAREEVIVEKENKELKRLNLPSRVTETAIERPLLSFVVPAVREPEKIMIVNAQGRTKVDDELELDQQKFKLQWKDLGIIIKRPYQVHVSQNGKTTVLKTERNFLEIPVPDEANGKLDWWVEAELKNGGKSQSDKQSVSWEMPTPITASPANGETISDSRLKGTNRFLTLGWKDMPICTEFEVQISKDGDFKNDTKTTRTKDHFLPFSVPGPGQYYWRVGCVFPNNLKTYSKSASFVIP
jgi:hypothetical protein